MNLMGLPVTALYGETCAAARVAVELGEDHARYLQPFIEGARDVDRHLTHHRIDGEQYLGDFDGLADLFELLHELFVYLQPARGIYYNGVEALRTGVFHSLFCSLYRVLRALFEHFGARVPADHFQLVYGGGAVDVARDEQRALAVLFEVNGELSAQRGLARALKAAHHDDRGRLAGDGELGVGGTHQRDELFVYYLYYLLRRIQAFEYLLPDRLFRDVGAELFCDLNVYVCLQKSDANFAHGRLDFKLGEPAALCEFGKYVI